MEVQAMASKDLVTFEMDGFAQLEKALKALPDRVGKRVLNNSLRAGARIIRDEARRLAPFKSGRLKKMLDVTTLKPIRNSFFTVLVGPKANAGWPYINDRKNSGVWRWLEFGTGVFSPKGRFQNAQDKRGRRHLTTIGGKLPKAVMGGQLRGIKPRPYLRPAFFVKKNVALTVIQDKMLAGIEKEAANLGSEFRLK
jgi:HK97 gp10 family phage protein